MNFFTHILNLVGSGTTAYISASQIRDPQTRPTVLAALQMSESGSVPFLEALSQRAASEGDTWLAEKLAKHADDETKHSQIFAHALKQMNKQVFADPRYSVESQAEEHNRSPFMKAYFEGYSQEQLKANGINWLIFMANTHVLEQAASKDFVRMANVLPENEPNSRNLKKGLLSIARDETGHAAYLYEAMTRRLPVAEVQKLVNEWRTRKVNALLTMAGAFLQGSLEMPLLVQDGVTEKVSDSATSCESGKVVLSYQP